MVHGIEAVACIFEPADNVRQRGGRVLRGVGVVHQHHAGVFVADLADDVVVNGRGRGEMCIRDR